MSHKRLNIGNDTLVWMVGLIDEATGEYLDDAGVTMTGTLKTPAGAQALVEQAASWVASTNVIAVPAHGWAEDQRLYFDTALGAVAADTVVYVVEKSGSDAFKVSLTKGGPAIDITADGSGNATPTDDVAGQAWPVAFSYVPGPFVLPSGEIIPDGNWRALLQDTLQLIEDTPFELHINAVDSLGGGKGNWVVKYLARERGDR